MKVRKPPITALSPAERTAKLLAFKHGHVHNFVLSNKTPSKQIHVASARFATA